jgi:hypothetical protein
MHKTKSRDGMHMGAAGNQAERLAQCERQGKAAGVIGVGFDEKAAG